MPRCQSRSMPRCGAEDEARFRTIEKRVAAHVAGDPTLQGLKGQIRFVRVQDGLRIDMVERADFAMFGVGNAQFSKAAAAMVADGGRCGRRKPPTR